MATVQFGNTSPVSKPVDPETGQATVVTYDHIVRTTTVLNIPPDWEMPEAFTTITHADGIWANHSDQKPAWVECDDWPELEAALRGYFGVKGRPKDWADEIGEVNA